MRAPAFVTLVAVLLAGCAAPGGDDGGSLFGPDAATFGESVRVGPNVGEPGLRVAADGTVWVHWPGGLHVSRDGGQTFEEVSFAPGVVVGGDADLALSADGGAMWYSDLEALLFLSVFTSTDGGATWIENPIASNVPLVDRQWILAGADPSRGGAESVYLVFNQLATGIKVMKSTTGGIVFESASVVQTQQSCYRGNIAITPEGVVAIADCDASGVRAYVSTDGGATFAEKRVAERASFSNVLFPIVATDAAGTLYFTWSERSADAADVWLSTSADAGETWTEPVRVNDEDETAIMPWVAAGDAGRIGVAYYGSPTRALPDEMPDDAEWFVRYAVATDASAGAPTFARSRVSNDVIQRGYVCLQGTACEEQLGGPGGRNLLDFFQVMPGPDGRAHLAWADGCDGCDSPDTSRDALVTYAAQTEGPRLHAG